MGTRAPSAAASGTSSATAGNSVPPRPASVATPCGALGCLSFASAGAAFEHVLALHPRVLAVGETHAQDDAPRVPSSTRRFAEQLLPHLAGKVKDMVIELVIANGKCGNAEKKTAEKQAPITEHQAPQDQNQFVVLGKVAKRMGIEPQALTPTCEEFESIANAGETDIARMLQMVADVTERELAALLDKPENQEQIVLSYGGALHNDLVPRPGQEAWSFGPRLAALTGSRYVELDLIVPEFIKDTETWRALPWYAAYQSAEPSSDTLLYNPNPNSFVLIFPRQLAVP